MSLKQGVYVHPTQKLFSLKTTALFLTTAITINLACVITNEAHAKIMFKQDDWYMDDSNPTDANAGVCFAATRGYINSDIYDFKVSLDKSGARPLEIIIYPEKKASALPRLIAQTKTVAGLNPVFEKLTKNAAGEDIFWYIPKNTQDFLQSLSKLNQFSFVVPGSKQLLIISLNGSKDTLTALNKACAAKTSKATLQTEYFEKLVIPSNFNSFKPEAVTPDMATKARDLIPTALLANQSYLDATQEVAKVDAKYADLRKQIATLKAQSDALYQDIADATLARDNALANNNQLFKEVNDIQIAIQNLQPALASAQQDVAKATADIAPYLPEHQRLDDINNNVYRDYDSTSNRRINIDNKISFDQKKMEALNKQVSDLKYDLSNLQLKNANAQSALTKAQVDYQSFREDDEINKILQADYHYNNLEQSISDEKFKIANINQLIIQKTSARENMNLALAQCKANIGHNIINQVVDRSTHRDGRSTPQLDLPAVPLATNNVADAGQPIDCSPIERQLNTLDSEISSANWDLSREQSNLNDYSKSRAQIYQDAADSARRSKNDLVDTLNEAQSEYSKISQAIASDNLEINDIYQRQLPQLNTDINSLSNERVTVSADEAAKRSAYLQSQAALDNYDNSVNYDHFDKALKTAQGTLDNIKWQIDDKNRLINADNTKITNNLNLRDAKNLQMKTDQDTITKLQTQSDAIAQGLTHYDDEKSAAINIVSQKQSQLAELVKEFATQLGLAIP